MFIRGPKNASCLKEYIISWRGKGRRGKGRKRSKRKGKRKGRRGRGRAYLTQLLKGRRGRKRKGRKEGKQHGGKRKKKLHSWNNQASSIKVWRCGARHARKKSKKKKKQIKLDHRLPSEHAWYWETHSKEEEEE